MSNDSTYRYLEDRIVDGLKLASDCAFGMGRGDRTKTDAALHSQFIEGLRRAEGAARQIAHFRGMKGQGVAWIKFAGKIGNMLDASTKAAGQTIANVLEYRPGTPRGPLWVRLGEVLEQMAKDCHNAAQARSDKQLIVVGNEFQN